MLSRVGCRLASAFAVALLTVSSAFGQATATYTYDALGRVVSSTTAGGSATYTYDSADNRTHLTACVSTCNHVPVANADAATVGNGATVVIAVLANDTDADSGDVLKVTGVGAPVNGKGTTSYTETNVSFTAISGQTGTDSFTYTISDGHPGGTATGTVTVTLNPAPPIANASSVTVNYNSSNNNVPLTITGGTPTSVAIAAAPSHGSATASGITISYTPTGGYSGSDSFTYTATNAGGTSAAATISVTVNSAPPVPPTVSPNNAAVIKNTSNNTMPLILGGGPATSVAVVSGVQHGTTSVSGTTITYTPTASYTGPDSFTYNATGPGGTSGPAQITISVNEPPPTAGANSATVAYNSSNNAMPLVIGGGPATSVAVARQALHGAATASGMGISYTPNSGYSGPDNFDYTVSGPGGTSNAATISIGVNTPAAPTANPVSMTVEFNSGANTVPISVTGIYNALGVNILPSKGTATVNGTTITYQPATGQSGSDSFYYYASGPGGTGSAAQVSVTINPGAPSLSAPVNTTSYLGSRDLQGWHPGTPVTVSPTGGSGGYTYSWHYVRGNSAITVSSATSATVTWTLPGQLQNFDDTAVWICTVTDSAGNHADTPEITVHIMEDTGQ